MDRDLYQEVIMDHFRNPRNRGSLESATHQAEGYNPLCGDKLKLWMRVEDDRIVSLRFEGAGCAISTAAASMMTEALSGRSTEEAVTLFHAYHNMVTGNEPADPALGKLAVFEGVREFPMRVKCATLPWHTMRAALEKADGTVSTE